ncbi:UPF0728 protein C10orf53 homolog isoform X4 [Heterocephalus glaber]|uniref:UPF0728 protein C10orf53 homolog isoform X4 n=1 Tax=Heterocephalus glaber TaxID=10181 RepID=A0AAX6SDX9_HETGA|nr:UPF0728 protein C10orf53 homolog isoform X4 [Heterocephalus glaber]
MPAKAEVILRYGPYSAVGLAVEHRTFRLEGLQAVLAKGGHKVVLEKIEEWNVVELMVNEDVVFQCTITDLEFEAPYCGPQRRSETTHNRALVTLTSSQTLEIDEERK